MKKITLSGTMPPAPPPPMTNYPPMSWHAQDPMPDRWMFNGEFCSVEEFAQKVWPNDEQAQLVFLLKYTK
jgi:hypothetical protein